MPESIRDDRSNNGVELIKLVFVNGVSYRKRTAVVFAFKSVLCHTSFDLLGKLG